MNVYKQQKVKHTNKQTLKERVCKLLTKGISVTGTFEVVDNG